MCLGRLGGIPLRWRHQDCASAGPSWLVGPWDDFKSQAVPISPQHQVNSTEVWTDMLSPRLWENFLSGASQQWHLGGPWTRWTAEGKGSSGHGAPVSSAAKPNTWEVCVASRRAAEVSGRAQKVSWQFSHAITHPYACKQNSFPMYSLFHWQSPESPCHSPPHLYAHLAYMIFFKRLKEIKVCCLQIFLV